MVLTPRIEDIEINPKEIVPVSVKISALRSPRKFLAGLLATFQTLLVEQDK